MGVSSYFLRGRLFAVARLAVNAYNAFVKKIKASVAGWPSNRRGIFADLPPFGVQVNNSVSNDKAQKRDLYLLRSVSQSVLPLKHRVHVCQKLPSFAVQHLGADIGISKNSDGRSFFHGFAVCGDARACPVCARKIGEVQASNIRRCLSWHRKENSGVACLVTFTVRHRATDNLKEIIDALCKSKRDFASWTAVKNAKKLLGYVNSISATDTTYSEKNGFHPHTHDIWLTRDINKPATEFCDSSIIAWAKSKNLLSKKGFVLLPNIKRFLAFQWQKACEKNGLSSPSLTRGFDILYRTGDGSDAVGAYLTKWARELATPFNKKGRNGSITPMQILARCGVQNTNTFSFKYSKLWREYVYAYKGRATVYFGKGLKESVGIDDLTDEQISEMELPNHVLSLSKPEYSAIIYFSAYRSVLNIADNYSLEILKHYISRLVSDYENRKRSYLDYQAELHSQIREYTKLHRLELQNMIDGVAA